MALSILIRKMLFLFLFTFTLGKNTNPRSCKNPQGKEVDWFVIFLFPETSSKNPLSYGYFDNMSQEMTYMLYDKLTFPGIRVIEEYEGKGTNYFFWNDDTTVDGGDKTSASMGRAHSKGGLIFDKDSGLLISHSLPRFPRRNEKNEIEFSFPSNAGIYGQTFICITVDKENAIKIVDTLNIINPSLVENVGSDMTQNPGNESVLKLIKNRYDSKSPLSKITEVTSKGGSNFEVFSKNKKEHQLPYDKAIPQHFNDGMYVETWTRPEMIPSICNETHQVLNVNNLNFNGFIYENTNEHSKWGVGIKNDFCCFGDLNRTESQKKRGGNVICLHNAKLADIMRKAITSSDTCSMKNESKFLEFLQ